VTTATAENALVVPARSVSGSGRNAFVTVRGASGDERRSVTTGISNGTLTQVTSGLEEGEEVVYTTPSASTGSTSTNSNQPEVQFFGPGGGPGGGIQVSPR
jgi:macrolide-specific efflux system membrane fusion protein